MIMYSAWEDADTMKGILTISKVSLTAQTKAGRAKQMQKILRDSDTYCRALERRAPHGK